MIPSQEIKRRIEERLKGSKAEILDPREDGIHLRAVVIYSGFKGKTLLQQHRMVYDTLKEELKNELHALQLETKYE